jgi:CheY-like chemotaxis protein
MVLVVDDHDDTCRLICRLLKKFGHPAACVTDPFDAIPRMREVAPTLVILDQTMPGRTGLDVFREMRASADLGAIPVIFYSAAFEAGVAKEALGLGASEWIVKGVHTPNHLIAAVERARVV